MQDGTPPDPDTRTQWAEARTDWAEDRTVLASERTFAGWMRTALASVAVGLGLQAVFRDIEPTWAAKGAASVFIAAALFLIWVAERAAARTSRKVDNHEVRSQSRVRLRIIAVILSLGAIAIGVILWML